MEKNYHTDNKSFMIYKEWEDYLEELENDEQIGQLFKALFAFAKRGEEAEFKSSRFDSTAFKQTHAELYAQYCKPTFTRRFSIA